MVFEQIPLSSPRFREIGCNFTSVHYSLDLIMDKSLPKIKFLTEFHCEAWAGDGKFNKNVAGNRTHSPSTSAEESLSYVPI